MALGGVLGWQWRLCRCCVRCGVYTTVALGRGGGGVYRGGGPGGVGGGGEECGDGARRGGAAARGFAALLLEGLAAGGSGGEAVRDGHDALLRLLATLLQRGRIFH